MPFSVPSDMRASFSFPIGREHRLLMQHAEKPPAFEQKIDGDMTGMDERVGALLKKLQKDKGITLTADRQAAIDRQRETIKDKLRFASENTSTILRQKNWERAQLLKEVEQLLWFAEYQVAQQKEQESGKRWKEIEETNIDIAPTSNTNERSIWIKAPATQTLEFTFASRLPQVSRLARGNFWDPSTGRSRFFSGRIEMDPNTISSSMEGAFQTGRWTDPKSKEHWFCITPDKNFEGTFTIYLPGGKRRTIDWQSDTELAAQRNRDAKRAEMGIVPKAKELPQPTQNEAEEYRQLVNDLAALRQKPTNDMSRLELRAHLAELEDLRKKIDFLKEKAAKDR